MTSDITDLTTITTVPMKAQLEGPVLAEATGSSCRRITLTIEPGDWPVDWDALRHGRRLFLAVVLLDEQTDAPADLPPRSIEATAIAAAHVAERDEGWISWVRAHRSDLRHLPDEIAVRRVIYESCQITSRREFKTNPAALRRWFQLTAAYRRSRQEASWVPAVML